VLNHALEMPLPLPEQCRGWAPTEEGTLPPALTRTRRLPLQHCCVPPPAHPACHPSVSALLSLCIILLGKIMETSYYTAKTCLILTCSRDNLVLCALHRSLMQNSLTLMRLIITPGEASPGQRPGRWAGPPERAQGASAQRRPQRSPAQRAHSGAAWQGAPAAAAPAERCTGQMPPLQAPCLLNPCICTHSTDHPQSLLCTLLLCTQHLMACHWRVFHLSCTGLHLLQPLMPH
jgi:hypothetical protein